MFVYDGFSYENTFTGLRRACLQLPFCRRMALCRSSGEGFLHLFVNYNRNRPEQ